MQNEFLKKTVYALLGRGNSALISFTLSFVVAKSFTLESAGIIFLNFTIILIVSTLLRLGSEVAIVKVNAHLSVYEANIRLENLIAFALNTTILFIFTFLTLVIASLFSDFNSNQYILIIFCSYIHSIGMMIAYDFQARKCTYIFNFLSSGLFPFSLLIIVLFFKELDISLIFLASTLITLSFSLVFYYFYSDDKLISLDKVFKVDLLERLKLSLRFLPISTLSILITWLTQLYVSFYLNEGDVAIISITQRVSMLLGFVVIAVNSIAAPNYAMAFNNKNFQKIRSSYYSSIKMCITFGFFPSLIVFIFPEQVLNIFGSQYSQESFVLLVFVSGQLFNILTGSVGQLLQMTGKENLSILSMLIAFLVNMILLIILVERFGVIGAAFSYSISYSTQNILNCFFVMRTLNDLERSQC